MTIEIGNSNYEDTSGPIQASPDLQHHHESLSAAPFQEGNQQSVMFMPTAMIMPMMSLSYVNFYFAFWAVTEVWQFVVLITACFIISLVAEYVKIRDAVSCIRSLIEAMLVRGVGSCASQRNQGGSKYFSGITRAVRGSKATSNRRMLFEGPEATAALANVPGAGGKTGPIYSKSDKPAPKPIEMTDYDDIDSAEAEAFLTDNPSEVIVVDDEEEIARRIHAVNRGTRCISIPVHFILSIISFALMIAAMSNLWLLLAVVSGGTVGYAIASWRNASTCESASKIVAARQMSRKSRLSPPPRKQAEARRNSGTIKMEDEIFNRYISIESPVESRIKPTSSDASGDGLHENSNAALLSNTLINENEAFSGDDASSTKGATEEAAADSREIEDEKVPGAPKKYGKKKK